MHTLKFYELLSVFFAGIAVDHSIRIHCHPSSLLKNRTVLEGFGLFPRQILIYLVTCLFARTASHTKSRIYQNPKNITMTDLKGTLSDFARRMFGAERKIRFRANYFPFTEPSAELDVECILCNGAGCQVCKYTSWLEILGCGMVHPTVLRNGGYDPAVYSGFAFGMGVDRLPMLRYGIDDTRLFYSSDLRFLRQF